MVPQAQAILALLCVAVVILLIVRATMGGGSGRFHGPDLGSSMTIGGREVQEDYVGTLATQAGLIAVLADGMGKAYGARIASRTAVETFLDLFRDYNAFDNPQYYFRKSFHTANRAILRELGDEGYGAASVGAAMIQDSWLFYAVVGNVKLCVYRGGDLVPVSAGHTLDVLAEESFRTGRLSREDALVMLENHRLYNYLGQDGFQDVEIFDRPIKLQQGDIIVLMSDGLYELIPWKEIEEVLASGQDCQSMAYSMIEKVNQNTAENKDIDFGSSNTTAGVYLDNAYFEQLAGDPITQMLKRDQVNYVPYLDVEHKDAESLILPSAVAVVGVKGQEIQYRFGYEARRLFHLSYIDEGFCVFYDLKRWVGDADRLEEVVDREGHRSFVPRKEIIRVYLEYVIECARQRFKCNFKSIHISAPVKQKPLFVQLFQELLPDYRLESENMLDEGVAVLYNTISTLIKEKQYKDGATYRALIIDCGGGTTDLSSCRFRITDRRVAYQIDIATAYENGNTDFGGNNLTFRVMQLLKLSLARQLGGDDLPDTDELIRAFDVDVFRTVDRQGVDSVYAELDRAYAQAERVIPTRFRDYEHRSRADYYAVKNNFYFLFETAERIKTSFYSHANILRMAVSSIPVQETATECMLVDRWKLSAFQGKSGTLEVLKDIPTAYINIYALNLLLRADIYGIVRQFMEGPYKEGELPEYSILRLTGQSCKIDIFRDALKEFIPGKVIKSSRSDQGQQDYELKLICLNGAIEYLKDKMFGYADVRITHEQAAFPYMVTAFTHTNQEVTLIHSLDRENTSGFISRNMADLTLKLYLKDLEGRQRYIYNCSCDPDKFSNQKAEEIVSRYSGQIRQDDLDDIVDRELKFFILADEDRWGFTVVPVLRREGQLQLGPDQFFRFETEGWVTNFFDGTR